MGGGLMQLVAYGAQDIYLTGNPQITFFKVVYRRHTNFSMESIKQTLNGTAIPVNGQSATCTVSRNGDLVHKVYVNIDHEAASAVPDYGKLIKLAELEIGGQMIDKQTSEWNNVWNELSTPESKAIGLKSMQGCVGDENSGVTVVQIPLNFWFCRNPGLALPLIALQYHEVKIKLEWSTASNATKSADVYCDYIYLDTDERRRFAQVSHEYLIEQVQLQNESKNLTAGANSTSFSLNFNHPVKELIWTTDSAVSSMDGTKLVLNGHDRFSEQSQEYFQLRQPFDYHTAVPLQNLPAAGKTGKLPLQLSLSPPQTVLNADVSTTITVSTAPGGVTGGTFTIGSGGTFNTLNTNAGTGGVAGKTVAIIVTAKAAANGITSEVGTIFFAEVDTLTTGNSVLTFKSRPISTSGAFLVVHGTAGIGATVATDSLSFSVVEETSLNEARTSKMSEKINVYSFALKPEEHQPSGTCNFSRIDNAQLSMSLTGTTGSSTVNIYAVNYNVLRIMSGMGGLAYSN
jgi:hypothetical protein